MSPKPRGRALIERAPHVEASLWRRLRYEAEMRCREALFHLHLPFAKRIANGEHRAKSRLGLERGDFEQLSFAALIEAIDRFDPLRGAPFQAFARVRIKGAIADGLARVSESGAQARFRRRIQAERARLIVENQDQGSDALTQLRELAALLALGFIAETFHHETTPANPLQTAAWRDLELSLAHAIEQLPEAEKAIIHNHYKLGVDFVQIAELLGCGKARVSQLHKSALARLRQHLSKFE